MFRMNFSIIWLVLTSLLASGIWFTSCGNAQESTTRVIINLTPEEFAKGIESDKVLLLDVRTEKEVNEGYISGATNLDFFGSDFDQSLNTLDKNAEVYVYCRSGGRSYKTAEKLEALGFQKVYNLDGGIGAWESAGKEIVANE